MRALLVLLVLSTPTYAQDFMLSDYSIVGQYYRAPYGGSMRLRPQTANRYNYWQTMPGGYPVINSPRRPLYQGYQGRYSPSPRTPSKK